MFRNWNAVRLSFIGGSIFKEHKNWKSSGGAAINHTRSVSNEKGNRFLHKSRRSRTVFRGPLSRHRIGQFRVHALVPPTQSAAGHGEV